MTSFEFRGNFLYDFIRFPLKVLPLKILPLISLEILPLILGELDFVHFVLPLILTSLELRGLEPTITTSLDCRLVCAVELTSIGFKFLPEYAPQLTSSFEYKETSQPHYLA